MSSSDDIVLFEEKQYMGQNRFSMLIRSLLALFCFVGYYWSENPKPVEISIFKIGSYPIENITLSGMVFFISGVVILLMSVLLTFILHIRTLVYKDHIILDGFWTTRRVKIDLGNVISIRKGKYKPNLFRRAVYNLHNRGIIRFYTSGDFFIEIVDDTGFTYRIGTHRPIELFRILQKN